MVENVRVFVFGISDRRRERLLLYDDDDRIIFRRPSIRATMSTVHKITQRRRRQSSATHPRHTIINGNTSVQTKENP